jgi:hypothetical protein
LRTWRSCWVASLLLAASVAHANGFAHGVCLAHTWRWSGEPCGYGTAICGETIQRLKKLGVDAVSLTPFGFMRSPADDTVHLNTHSGESDQALAAAAKQAHAAGMQVMLKPHVWIHRGDWIGAQVITEDSWPRWFESYRAFILHYAELAQREKMDWLVIGTELSRAAVRDRARWAALIGEIRRVYKGSITYAANWNEEGVVFWDLVDALGVQLYEPPTDKRGASLDELRAGWKKIVARLDALSARTGKKILVTELGYRATRDAHVAPSTWPESERNAPFDGEEQARCYRAALEALMGAKWCTGVYVWKWFTDSRDEQGPTDFSPAGKPAEKVLGEMYRR